MLLVECRDNCCSVSVDQGEAAVPRGVVGGVMG